MAFIYFVPLIHSDGISSNSPCPVTDIIGAAEIFIPIATITGGIMGVEVKIRKPVFMVSGALSNVHTASGFCGKSVQHWYIWRYSLLFSRPLRIVAGRSAYSRKAFEKPMTSMAWFASTTGKDLEHGIKDWRISPRNFRYSGRMILVDEHDFYPFVSWLFNDIIGDKRE